MTEEERTARDKEDLRALIRMPEFKRFLWRTIQLTRIYDRTADGSQHEAIVAIARRNLGLEILEMVEAGQPVPHPEGQPILTMLQVLHEEANQPGGKSDRRIPDRYADLRDDD